MTEQTQDRKATPAETLAETRRLGLHTPDEATELIRAARDGRPKPVPPTTTAAPARS